MMTKERRADLEALADKDPHMCLLRELLNEIAELEARAVVVPDDTFTLDLDEFGEKLACITISSKNRGVGYELCGTMGDGHFSRRTFDITPYLAHCLNTIGVRAIPADRVLGEGMIQVDPREWNLMQAVRSAADQVIQWSGEGRSCGETIYSRDARSQLVSAIKSLDSLRANQGGAAT